MGKHDALYKKLFSNPKLIEELLTSFVSEDFVVELDFSTIEQLDKSFVTESFKEKESDIIYKVNFRGEDVYLFILIEFQSTVDRFMSLRILRYILEFYDFYITSQKEKKIKIDKLPSIFPILLYNGDDKWLAAENIKDIIKDDIPLNYIPDFSYFKIIENSFSKEQLLKIRNAVSAIFFVENTNPKDLSSEIENLVSLIEEESPEIIKVIRSWFVNLLGVKNDIVEKIDDIKEVRTMFATALKEYGKELKEEGKFEDAKEMIIEGFESDVISRITKLPIDKINELKAEVDNQ